jgi:hypothetical protein
LEAPSIDELRAFQIGILAANAPLRPSSMMRYCIALAGVFGTVFAISGASSAQDFMVEPGASTAFFPKPNRPVADTVSPIWHDEKARDAAGEPSQ